MKILVTGGAGYIGSFMVKALLDKGDEVIVFDNLERGHQEAIDKRAKFIKGDLRNSEDLIKLFSQKYDAVLHFAGLISVGESQQDPDLYYQNNVVGSKNFFEKAIDAGVNNLIFSSSAAVYGNPVKVPIPEDHPKNPTSNYGGNKLEIEKILENIRNKNSQANFVALRYFNAAGAALDGSLGENHNPETHIIPVIFNSILLKTEFKLMGTDYKTPDGTCIRDYIHVLDLVDAHVQALKMIQNKSGGYFYNVGTGKGYSNKEVIEAVERITGEKINVEKSERRTGDADELVADVSKIKAELGFEPKYSDLETIINSAWKWHNKK